MLVRIIHLKCDNSLRVKTIDTKALVVRPGIKMHLVHAFVQYTRQQIANTTIVVGYTLREKQEFFSLFRKYGGSSGVGSGILV